MEPNNRVVSSDDELLILVDREDREIGFLAKADAHRGRGTLHRAFSLFVFNPAGHLLLQQRTGGKRLWPGYWSNTCCSHPRRGEKMDIAVRRRLQEELGLRAELGFLFKFRYQAQYDAQGAEHELCWVYAGRIPLGLTMMAGWWLVVVSGLGGSVATGFLGCLLWLPIHFVAPGDAPSCHARTSTRSRPGATSRRRHYKPRSHARPRPSLRGSSSRGCASRLAVFAPGDHERILTVEAPKPHQIVGTPTDRRTALTRTTGASR